MLHNVHVKGRNMLQWGGFRGSRCGYGSSIVVAAQQPLSAAAADNGGFLAVGKLSRQLAESTETVQE